MSWDRLEVGELFDDALFGEQPRVEETTDGAHGQAAVLKLSELVLLESFRVLPEAERVETEVSRCAVTVDGFEQGDGAKHFQEADPQQQLRHGPSLDEEGVCLRGSQVLDAWEHPQFGEHPSQGGQHSNTAYCFLCSKSIRAYSLVLFMFYTKKGM